MSDKFEQYRAPEEPFWSGAYIYGDGYDVLERAESRKWNAIAGWGKSGYDLGSWPYVIVFFRDREKDGKPVYDVLTYVEGDTTRYECPTKEIRNQITDGIAFFYWKHAEEEWVAGYETVDDLPEELRGPCGRRR